MMEFRTYTEGNNSHEKKQLSYHNLTNNLWRVERVIILFCYFNCNSSIYILVFFFFFFVCVLLLLFLFYLSNFTTVILDSSIIILPF